MSCRGTAWVTSINRAEGVWNCKAGSCGLSGNLLDFVQRLEALRGEPATLPHAARKLAAICGVELPGQNGPRNGPEARPR